MNKTMNAAQVVASLQDGMVLGIGGWGARRKPMALIREILRSPLKNLHLVSYGGPEVGMLCAAGKVSRLTYGFVSLDLIPLDPYFRIARQEGQLEVMEVDEGMLGWGLRAAAMRLPFLPTRVGLATDVLTMNPQLKTVRSPYEDGEELLAMPALQLDAALLHVHLADERGNSQILGPDPFFDEWFARAAARTYLSCEEQVPALTLDNPSLAATFCVERSLVHGVVQSPCGAHPTSCAPAYGMDLAHLRSYVAGAKEEGGWTAYFERCLAGDEASYLEAVGGVGKVRSLPLPVF